MEIINNFFSPPSYDEIEITLLGTGGGYGESIVVKINNNDWIIIDSCINPKSKIPLPLEYLSKINVDFKTQVKKVICTHWHDDHIQGLSNILESCENAIFCMPHVNDTKKFLLLVGLDYSKEKKGSISSFKEFKKCLEIIEKRENKNIRRLKSDLIIYSDTMTLSENNDSIEISLFSLSPSEAVILNFDKEISKLISDFQLSKKTITEKSANEKCSVIYLKYGEYSALIGADLEVGNNKDEGWNDIYNNSVLIKDKSIIYKIPHHGSENGYDKKIYETLVNPEAIIKLSPWNRNNKLPKAEMIKTYKSHSDNVYITSSSIASQKPKKRDKSINKIIDMFSRKLSEVKYHEGIVRTRHSMIRGKEIIVEVHGTAFKV